MESFGLVANEMIGLVLLLVRLVFRPYKEDRFFNIFCSFQQLLKYSEFVLYDELIAGILYCNFFLFHMQLLSSRPIA